MSSLDPMDQLARRYGWARHRLRISSLWAKDEVAMFHVKRSGELIHGAGRADPYPAGELILAARRAHPGTVVRPVGQKK